MVRTYPVDLIGGSWRGLPVGNLIQKQYKKMPALAGIRCNRAVAY